MKAGQRNKHKKPGRIYDFNEADDRLFDIFRNHGFEGFPHENRHQLVRFYQILMEQQISLNFTRLVKFRDIAIKHFIDCLIVPQLTALQFPLLDVGSGPGFPGIPLKIVFPEERIILAEGVRKRVEFLKLARESLKLKNLDILGHNIEEDFAYPVEGVITRAFEDIRGSLPRFRQCLSPGGRVYFMKGPGVEPELKDAKADFTQDFKFIDDISYDLPQTPHQRRLVIFERI